MTMNLKEMIEVSEEPCNCWSDILNKKWSSRVSSPPALHIESENIANLVQRNFGTDAGVQNKIDPETDHQLHLHLVIKQFTSKCLWKDLELIEHYLLDCFSWVL